MNLHRHSPTLLSALAVAVLTAQPMASAEAGVVRLLFNNSSQAIGLNQTSGELIRYLNHTADRYLSLRLSEPLLCAEFPSGASSSVRVRFIDANGDVVANNNTSGTANTFGSLTDVAGSSGGIRYLPVAGGENRLQLNTTNALNCMLFSTFITTGANLGPDAKVQSGYQLRQASQVMKAGPEGGDLLFEDGFEDEFLTPVDIVTTISAPSTVRAGTNYIYTITVRNQGTTALTGVQVRDFFYKRSAQPGGNNPVLESGSWTCAGSNGGTCGATSGSGVIYASGISLPSGGQVAFTATRRVNDSPVPSPGSNFSVAAGAFINPSLGETLVSNNGAVANATIVVTQPPTISGLPASVTIPEDGNSGDLSFTLQDPDTSTTLLTTTTATNNSTLFNSAGMVVSGSGGSRSLRITPIANQSGSGTVTVNVSDGSSVTPGTVNVTVTPVNDAPSFTWNNGCTVVNGGTWTPENGSTPGQFTYPAGASVDAQSCLSFLNVSMGPPDESAQSLTNAQITAVSNPAIFASQPSLQLKGGNTALLLFRTNGASGTAEISVQVTDNGGTANNGVNVSTVKTFRVKVDGAAPTITAIGTQSINEDGSTGALPFVIGDTDTPVANLILTTNSSNPAVVPQGNVVLGGSAENRTITVTPAANAFGSSTITVTVSDGDQQGQRTFVVNVASVNDAPTFVDGGNIILPSGTTKDLVQQDGWATQLVVGPPNESAPPENQTPVQFLVSVLSTSPTSIGAALTVDAPSGNLTLELQPVAGVVPDGYACFRVRLRDSGPSTSPNVNISAGHIIKVEVGNGGHNCNP